MGLKFLRDGVDSANLVSMYSVNGNPKGDHDFFSQIFSNHIGPGTTTATEALSKKFSSATEFITSIGLSDFARYGADGKEVSNPIFPFAINFKPNKAIANNKNSYFIDQLKGVPADSLVYEVWAFDKPEILNGSYIHIGDLVIDGSFTTSKFGDKEFFIRHQKADDDIKLMPGWSKYYARYDLGGKCPFTASLEEMGIY